MIVHVCTFIFRRGTLCDACTFGSNLRIMKTHFTRSHYTTSIVEGLSLRIWVRRWCLFFSAEWVSSEISDAATAIPFSSEKEHRILEFYSIDGFGGGDSIGPRRPIKNVSAIQPLRVWEPTELKSLEKYMFQFVVSRS